MAAFLKHRTTQRDMWIKQHVFWVKTVVSICIYMHCSKRINTLIVRNCENKNKHLHTAYAFLKNASLPLTALINISTSSWSKRFLKQKTYYITWSRTPVLLFAFFLLIFLIFGCFFCFVFLFGCLFDCLIFLSGICVSDALILVLCVAFCFCLLQVFDCLGSMLPVSLGCPFWLPRWFSLSFISVPLTTVIVCVSGYY